MDIPYEHCNSCVFPVPLDMILLLNLSSPHSKSCGALHFPQALQGGLLGSGFCPAVLRSMQLQPGTWMERGKGGTGEAHMPWPCAASSHLPLILHNKSWLSSTSCSCQQNAERKLCSWHWGCDNDPELELCVSST